MIDTKLIMLEGLPSTGKSTNADFIRMQLERNGKKVIWIHEVASPHPVFLFFEPCSSLNEYEEAVIEKWEHFAETASHNKDTVYILDSSIFQSQVFTFLWDNASYERLEKFVNILFGIVKYLNPTLIYLYRENSEDTIDYLEKNRGTQGLINIYERDKTRPYYQNKPKGANGFKQFLRDYAKSAELLFNSLDCKKISIEITELDWTNYENKMLSFLEIETIPSPNFVPPNGIYKNEEFGYKITVDGLMIIDPDGSNKKLTPKTANDFYIERLPMILHFEDSKQVIMTGLEINAHWSTTGMMYKRQNSLIKK